MSENHLGATHLQIRKSFSHSKEICLNQRKICISLLFKVYFLKVINKVASIGLSIKTALKRRFYRLLGHSVNIIGKSQ